MNHQQVDRSVPRRACSRKTSAISFIRCRIEAFQIHARIVRGELPVDLGLDAVSGCLPSCERPGTANRAFEILRAMMLRAEEWGLREGGSNPCLGIAKNPRNRIARFLDMDELAWLGRALDAREARWPEAVAAIRLLALTGCRRSEKRSPGGDATTGLL